MNHPLQPFVYCPVCGSKTFTEANEKAKQCSACGFIYYLNPSAAVACFIRNPKGELLFVRRGIEPAKGTLDVAGGFVDLRETAEEAVRREVREETGLVLSEIHYLFSIPNLYPFAGFEVQTLDLFYECVVPGFDTAKASDDAAEVVILPLDCIRSEDFGLCSIQQGVEQYICMK